MASNNSFSIPYRITIGVTGHRVLDNENILRNTVQDVIKDILESLPKSKKTAIKLCAISPLAEGADRLVADEILKYDEDSTLKVVLPLAKEDYMEDFQTEESQIEFRHLLKKDRSPLSLKNQLLVEEYPLEFRIKARKQAYEDVGKFVVNHCDVLIAIWDGEKPRGKGGTAHIVKYAQGKKCPLYIIKTQKPDKFSQSNTENINVEIFKKIHSFNDDFTDINNSQYIDNYFNSLFDNDPGKAISNEIKSNIKEKLFPYYVAASIKSKDFQKLYRKIGLWVFWMAFLSVTIIGSGVIFFHHPPIIIFIIEFIILSMIFGLITYADRKRSHKNWLEYRFLTERMRTAIFLGVSGVDIPSKHITRNFEHQTSNDWLLFIFEEIWDNFWKIKSEKNDSCEVIGKYLKTAWFEDQISFHKSKFLKTNKMSKRCERSGEAIYFIALFAAFSHFAIIPLLPHIFHHFHSSLLDNLLILVALALPALAATVEAIRTHREYKSLSLHSKNMINELEILKKSLVKLIDNDLLIWNKLEELVINTDNVMLEDVRSWVSIVNTSELYKAV